MIGQTISHYKILEKLGEGGMGIVYKAQDISLDRTVALKLLPSRTVVTDDDKARFSNEARAAAKLAHPNIATVYEFGEADGETFLAMEYIEGETLSKKVHRGPLSIADVLKIVGEIAAGLGTAHQRGIIHRDIKSENIMLTPEGTVRIMDFGLAQIRGQSRLWHTEGTAGTVSYMSPEQARGESLDERTDIWSLGVVFYEMLTGKLPFPGNYEAAILYLIIHEQPESMKSIRDDVPTNLQEVVARCLKKDSAQRYRNIGELQADVNSVAKELEQGLQKPQETVVEPRHFETERRPVTIMFATILATSQESEDLDPEALTAGLDECFDGLTSIIQKYGGMKDRIVGDRLMAVFGAPTAHENDPERAVRCAQEMMSYVKRLNALGVSQVSTALQLKIGIHSGVVVAGNVGSEKGAGYSVVGDVINVAAGITDLGEPGEIHLSADTLKLVGEIVEIGEPQTICLKGKTQEIQVYKLQSLRAGIEPGRRAVGTGAFVGRGEEIRLFEESLGRVQKKGEVRLFVRGEAGVGKTRLKVELTNRALKRKMLVCEGKCSSFETSTPYYLWNTLLKSLLRVDQETPESEVRSRLHEMAKMLTIESDEPYLATLLSLRYEEILLEEDEQRKRKIFDAARRLLKTYAERKASVFLFEDLHWIDRFSQNLLEFVLSGEQLGPALIVCFYRPEYAGAKTITESGRELDLNRLPGAEALELMHLRLGAESLPENLANLIEQRSEGNPFFIEEIIKTLLDKGIVSVKKGKLEVQSEKLESGVPETLQGVILARIDRLEERIREVLLDASVIGREFSRPVLEHIVRKKIDVKGELKKLESLELVFEKEEARELEYLFKHYLIQEVAYNTLLQKKRKQIHVLIAQAIEKLYAERLKEFYEILAFHYEKAEEWEKAATFLSMSGRKVEEIFSKEESKDFYGRKTEAVEKLYSSGPANRPILKWIIRVFVIIYVLPICLSMTVTFPILYSKFSREFDTVLKWIIGTLFLLLMSAGSLIIDFTIFLGAYSLSFRKGPTLYDVMEDHVLLKLANGKEYCIQYAEIMSARLQMNRGFLLSLVRNLKDMVTLKYFNRNYFLTIYLALPRSFLFNRKDAPIGASLSLSARQGMVYLLRRSGISSLKRILMPWKILHPEEADTLGLTPTNPAEFFQQLSSAYEMWRKKQSTHTYVQSNDSSVPLFTFRPQYDMRNMFANSGCSIIAMYCYSIYETFMFIAYPVRFNVGLFVFMILIAVIPDIITIWVTASMFLARKRYSTTRFEFYTDKVKYFIGFPGATSGELYYRDITRIKHEKGHFGVGTIELVTARPIEIVSGENKRSALYLFDMKDSEKLYDELCELIKPR